MKVGLVCIVKNENQYLEEYVNYYHNLGVDTFYIYDNNNIDGENVLDVLSKFDYVKIINYRGKCNCQNQAYESCMKNYNNEFDWLCVFDADEFLFLNEDKNIKHYLNRPCFKDITNIQINWRNVDDNGLIGNENNSDRSILTRFVIPEPYENKMRLSKTIIRSSEKIKVLNPHYIICDNVSYSNNKGDKLLSFNGECSQDWTLAELRHYRKTIIEFIENKLNRGWADNCDLKLDFEWFWHYSQRTPEKEEIAKKYLINNSKKVIYTCITGGYDTPTDNFIKKEGYSYILFSDVPIKTNCWKNVVVNFEGAKLNNVKRQRWIKTHPHKMLSDYDVSVWIDSNTSIDDKLYKYIEENIVNVVTFKNHPNRDCIYEEIKEVVLRSKETQLMGSSLYDLYKSKGFPEHYGLFETNVIIRQHNNKRVKELMESWWNDIMVNSHRDQLSLNYVIWRDGYSDIIHAVSTKDFPPKIHKNIKDA